MHTGLTTFITFSSNRCHLRNVTSFSLHINPLPHHYFLLDRITDCLCKKKTLETTSFTLCNYTDEERAGGREGGHRKRKTCRSLQGSQNSVFPIHSVQSTSPKPHCSLELLKSIRLKAHLKKVLATLFWPKIHKEGAVLLLSSFQMCSWNVFARCLLENLQTQSLQHVSAF